MADDDDSATTAVLRQHTASGAGIRRQPVHFVPASTASTPPTAPPPRDGTSIAEQYLAIVRPNRTAARTMSKNSEVAATPHSDVAASLPQPPRCAVCGQLSKPGADGTPHEASMAHQISLPHSHPPSSIDRTRKGLSFLQSWGWDPDARVGLGKDGQGRLFPVQATEKRDSFGLGLKVDRKKVEEVDKKPKTLSAKAIRAKDKRDKERTRRLREEFYTDESVMKHMRELE